MPPEIIDCDVLIQAGHENTPDNMTGAEGPLGREIDWTPIVANEAVRLLKQVGINAIKETAHIKVTRQQYRCDIAVFVHFDGAERGETGPSVGYDHASDAEAAEEWKTLYSEFFPFNETWRSDNYTNDEHFYYGFRFTVTRDAEFLIELGDINSFRQAQWLKPRLKWLGHLLAYFVSKRTGKGNLQKPEEFVLADARAPHDMQMAAVENAPVPVGAPEPFTTDASISGNENGQSKTKGLIGRKQKFDDGSIVIEATEALSARRADGMNQTLTAFCRRVEKGDLTTVQQENYSYLQRKLPLSILTVRVKDLPVEPPEGFKATPTRHVRASQFGKNDHEDEGTGSPIMELIQTNSEVFGASLKISVMKRIFGDVWRDNDARLGAMAEIHFADTQRMVRVPLVDIGPAEHVFAEIDLTWACDQFLGTQGQADVSYRILFPL